MNIRFFVLLTLIKSLQGETTTDYTDDGISSITPIIETKEPPVNYCVELLPYCSCFLSSIIIKCDNFDLFSKLDFKPLQNGTEPKKIYELELSPVKPIIIDSSLDLTGLQLYDTVKIRNIKGFEFKSNPFDSVRNGKGLNLYLYDSSLDFYEDAKIETKLSCSSSVNRPITSPIFKAFSFIQIENVKLNGKICPIVFKNAVLRSLNLNYITKDVFNFDPLDEFDDLNSTIETLRIFSSYNFKLDTSILNKFVFSKLKTLDLDYTELKKIEDDTFLNLKNLKTILIVIENYKEFIQSSNNTWMKSLNSNINVNLNDSLAIQNSKNESMLVTINNRNNGQSYLYPDEDQVYFENWPHEKMVFLRILSDQNLICSKTLKFLLKYANNYKTPSTLSTTSTEACFKPELTTTSSISTELSTDELSTKESTNMQTSTSTPDVQGVTSSSSSSKPSIISTTTKEPTTKEIVTTTKELEETVSLSAFLGTVLPLAIISVASFVGFLVFYCKFKTLRSKVIPTENFPLS